MKLKILIGLASVFVVGFLLLPKTARSLEKVEVPPTATDASLKADIKATFEIYTNGTKRVFTDPKYHYLSDDVFLTEEDPGDIQIHKEGVTWQDFFDTLPMSVSKDCLVTGTGQTFCTSESGELQFFLNSVNTPNALDLPINDGDVLIIRYT